MSSVCDPNTFKQLFEEHSRTLYNFLYYKTKDSAAAEDLVQDAYIRLWKNCAKVTIEKVKSFLYTVGNNLFLDKVKHEKVVLKFQQQAPVRSIERENPQFLLEESEFKSQLEQAIDQLSEGQRVVFLMNRIDKKTYREIAETLGISVKAVEKRMHKALKSLRQLTKKI